MRYLADKPFEAFVIFILICLCVILSIRLDRLQESIDDTYAESLQANDSISDMQGDINRMMWDIDDVNSNVSNVELELLDLQDAVDSIVRNIY